MNAAGASTRVGACLFQCRLSSRRVRLFCTLAVWDCVHALRSLALTRPVRLDHARLGSSTPCAPLTCVVCAPCVAAAFSCSPHPPPSLRPPPALVRRRWPGVVIAALPANTKPSKLPRALLTGVLAWEAHTVWLGVHGLHATRPGTARGSHRLFSRAQGRQSHTRALPHPPTNPKPST